jgi:hypothetical protein
MRSRAAVITKMIFLACGGLLTTALRAADEAPRVEVVTERDRIYEGETVLYRVTVENVDNPREPTLKGFDDFEIATLGQQSLDQQQITIINGQRTDIVHRGRQFNYRLTPKRAGTFKLPAPSVEVGGKTIRGRSVSLTVVAPQDQDLVRMEIKAEPAAVYPMQPLRVTLAIAVKSLPDSLAERNPVSVQADPPALSVPWADDKNLPDGLVPQTDLAHWLGPLENGRGWGFSVNNIGSASIIAMFEERKLAFMPKPEKIRLPDRSGKDADYWQFNFMRTFVPKQIDEYTFGPVSLKGRFAVKEDESGQVLGQDVFAVAKAITVKIKEVPREGRPESYIGAVGQFHLTSELTPRKPQVVRTGDPMTLVLSLSGEGALESATPPDLSKNPLIAKNFKIYDATAQTKPGQRQFTYSLRPLTTELTEFPPIEASCFNPESEQFDTLRTEAVPVAITKSDKLADRDIVASSNAASQRGKEIETRQEGIYANATDWSRLTNQSIEPGRWAACWGAMLGGYGLLALVVTRFRQLGGDTARVRRNSAAHAARRLLKQGRAELAAGRDREGAESIEDALLNLVADWTNSPAAGMTASEACRLLESIEVPAEVIAAVKNCLEQCEAMRFGGTLLAADVLRKVAEPVLERLIKTLRLAKRGAAG